MAAPFDQRDQDSLVLQMMSTLPTSMGHVRLIIPDSERGGYRQVRYEANRTGHVLRHRIEEISSDKPWGKELSWKGRRLFVVHHEDRPWTRECILPIHFGVHVLGWVGAPLPKMEYWTRHVRNSWARWIQDFAGRTGSRLIRTGDLPEYETDGPIFTKRSLMSLASHLSDSGEGFGMLTIQSDRLEMTDSHADLLRALIREGDAVGLGDSGAMALCIRGSSDGIRSRLGSALSDAVEVDWRLSGEIRYGYCVEGKFRDVSIHHIRPVGRVVPDSQSSLSGTFKRLGLIQVYR